MTIDRRKRWRAQEAFAWRERGLTYPAIASRLRCSLSTARHYVDLWERHLRAVERAQRIHMRWFGVNWEAPINQTCDHIETPVGATCMVCSLNIYEHDQGLLIPRLDGHGEDPIHLRCFLYAVGAA